MCFSTGNPAQADLKFRKEPKYAGAQVRRGVLPVGQGLRPIAFAFDPTARKLYLDLNGNFDLTDDPGGTFDATPLGAQMTPSATSAFSAAIELTSGTVRRPYKIQVTSLGLSPYQSLAVLSGWKGELDLGGRKWRMKVADDLDGRIAMSDTVTLEPVLTSGTKRVHRLSMERIPVFPRLCLDGHVYNVDYRFEPTTTGPAELVVAVAETTVPMGKLRVAGSNIEALILSSPSLKVACAVDSPSTGAVVSLPAGQYSIADLTLSNGFRMNMIQAGSAVNRSVAVPAGGAVDLVMGGPLRNSIKVEKRGVTAILDYKLEGIGGEEYQTMGRNLDNAPQFEVYQGDRLIASGKFEYG